MLCPVSGGALKPTVEGEWVHIMCGKLAGMQFPEPRLEPAVGLLAIVSASNAVGAVECSRATCSSSSGFQLKCAHPDCSHRFHVPCAILDRSIILLFSSPTIAPPDTHH